MDLNYHTCLKFSFNKLLFPGNLLHKKPLTSSITSFNCNILSVTLFDIVVCDSILKYDLRFRDFVILNHCLILLVFVVRYVTCSSVFFPGRYCPEAKLNGVNHSQASAHKTSNNIKATFALEESVEWFTGSANDVLICKH